VVGSTRRRTWQGTGEGWFMARISDLPGSCRGPPGLRRPSRADESTTDLERTTSRRVYNHGRRKQHSCRAMRRRQRGYFWPASKTSGQNASQGLGQTSHSTIFPKDRCYASKPVLFLPGKPGCPFPKATAPEEAIETTRRTSPRCQLGLIPDLSLSTKTASRIFKAKMGGCASKEQVR